jgi:diadenosine tetraphosphatase ApaH/serine/threonine PP2A family protein phosphatase
MRWLLLADIHGNVEALSAVLSHAQDWPDAGIIVAGDTVGYGPDPEACIELLAERDARCVAGNHEGMVLGRIGLGQCNHAGILAARWTREVLSARAWRWIAALPEARLVADHLLVFHGDLDDPTRYLDRASRADALLASLAGRGIAATRAVCGHTHHPSVHREGEADPWARPPVRVPISLRREQRCLLNPGAVGQSRFESPIARYARYDDEADVIVFHAVPYDDQAVCRKLRRKGLVPRVTLPPATRIEREIERLQTRWARRWYG